MQSDYMCIVMPGQDNILKICHIHILCEAWPMGVYVMTKWIKRHLPWVHLKDFSCASWCLTNPRLCKWPKRYTCNLRHLFVFVEWLIFYFILFDILRRGCTCAFSLTVTDNDCVFRSTVNYELWLDLFYNWTCVQK